MKMENRKIPNYVNYIGNESAKLPTIKCYIINDQTHREYSQEKETDSTVNFETKVIKPFLCDYSHAYILVTEDITVTGIAADTNIAFKNCAPTRINHEHIETAERLDIIMAMYYLLEYSDNYADFLEVYMRLKEVNVQ